MSPFRAFIEEVRERSDIVEVVGRHVELDGRHRGRCPFHDDSHPSFSVVPDDQYFHCFGCGVGGDVFRFVERIEGVGFQEAVQILAERAGVPPLQLSEEESQKAQAQREAEDLLAATATYYHERLPSAASAYLTTKRGLPQEILERFQVGWADGSLKEHLVAMGYTEEQGIQAGVLVRREGRVRDFFFQRVVFPVMRHGRIVFLTGRTLRDVSPKWLHLAGERPLLFHEAALRHKEIYVTEGVFDALALEVWGLPAVALLGTGARLEELAPRLRRIERVYLCLDGDAAGTDAARTLGRLLVRKARIVDLPAGKDPNDLLVEKRREEFERCVQQAKDPVTWEIEKIPVDLDQVELADRMEGILPLLADWEPSAAEAFLAGPLKERFSLTEKLLAPCRREVKELRKAKLREARSSAKGRGSPDAEPYIATEDGLVWSKPTTHGDQPVLLTNFTAKIVEHLREDDGVETRDFWVIQAEREGRGVEARVSASSFGAMNWVPKHLGPGAFLEAGFELRDHARVAIQYTSPPVPVRVCYTHLGWRRLEEAGWCYLTASGALGSGGLVPGVEVRLEGPLSRFALPAPGSEEQQRQAIRDSLRILDLGPPEIVFPLFATVWRAVLGETDFSVHVVGPTGTLKTATAAVLQSFWGSELDDRHLPGSWSSTGNFLEDLAFLAKDALMVVDDFAPSGSVRDAQRDQREAERLLRAQGNRSGRGRMRQDGSLRPSRPPRGLLLSTGEDVPGGQSIRARMLVLELSPGSIQVETLSECQAAAEQGCYAQALASFIQWVAPKYEDIRKHLLDSVRELRSQGRHEGQHRRTSSAVAELRAGFEVWLRFAVERGAVEEARARELQQRCSKALQVVAASQAAHIQASEPVQRFLELLSSAISSGKAHVADPKGELPRAEDPKAWGWRREAGGEVGAGWKPLGGLVGWIEGEDLYLDLTAAYKAAQEMAAGVDGISVSPRTLVKRLAEKGLLISQEADRGKHLVRRELQGKRRNVLHLTTDSLVEFRALGALRIREGGEGPLRVGRGSETGARTGRGEESSGPGFGPRGGKESQDRDGFEPRGPQGPEGTESPRESPDREKHSSPGAGAEGGPDR